MNDEITRRKQDHIEIALSSGSQFPNRRTGFADYWFIHEALPEISLDEIDLSVQALGKTLNAPLLIASMTGGPQLGAKINRHLAEAAQELGLGMGVGSQRITFERPEALDTFQIRPYAPDILLLSNLGAVQFNYGFDLPQCIQAVEQIGADALYLHLNPLQEAVQPEGDTNFKDLLPQITKLCEQAPFPILAKECGCGISERTARKLLKAGIQGIEVSGAGGTSWALIEAARAAQPWQRQLGETFGDWGIPTTLSIQMCRAVDPDLLVIGSGGIRSGLDAAKAIALGADLVSTAQPLLQAATESTQAVIDKLQLFIRELKVAMLCVGARNLAELRQAPLMRG